MIRRHFSSFFFGAFIASYFFLQNIITTFIFQMSGLKDLKEIREIYRWNRHVKGNFTTKRVIQIILKSKNIKSLFIKLEYWVNFIDVNQKNIYNYSLRSFLHKGLTVELKQCASRKRKLRGISSIRSLILLFT